MCGRGCRIAQPNGMLAESTYRGSQPLDLHEYVLWQHPHSVGRVYFRRDVVRTLSSQALHFLRENAEIGGVLWGKLGPADSTLVERAEPVPAVGPRFNTGAVDLRAVVQALSGQAPQASLSPVGYYRTHLREGLFLSPQDRAIIEQHLREPEFVFLVLKPFEAGVCTAGLFFWRDGQLPEESELEVPFLGEKSPGQDSVGGTQSQPEEPSIVDMLRHSAMQHDKPRRAAPKPTQQTPSAVSAGQKPKQSSWGVIVIAALVIALLFGFGTLAFLKIPGLRTLLQGAPEQPQETAFALKAVRNPDGQLTLTWNQNSPEIANARSATLFISDGRRSPKLPLDAAQLHSGTLLYSPRTAHPQFRLELNMADGRTVVESLSMSPSPSDKQRPGAGQSGRGIWPGMAPGLTPMIGTTEVIVPVYSKNERPDLPPAALPGRPFTLPGISVPGSGSDSNAAYVPPRVMEEMMPQAAPSGRFARVAVRVSIDPNGQVISALPAENSSSTSTLIASALTAAREWRFLPATLNGKPVPADYTIVFAFRPAAP